MNNKEIVELLLARNAELNAQNKDGCTPLFVAVLDGNKEVVEALLAHKANVNATDNNGFTPLHVAVSKCYNEVIKLLLAHGANVNAKSVDGLTPLQEAAVMKRNDVVALLVAKDISAQPTEVLLTEKASIPAIVDGKQVGLVELRIGTKLKLNSVQGEQLKVMFNGNEQIIPLKNTDLVTRVLQNCLAKAIQEKKAADLKHETENAAKEQQAAEKARLQAERKGLREKLATAQLLTFPCKETRTEGSDFVEINSEVKNLSNTSLNYVEAVARYYTEDDTFISSESYLLKFNPLLPNQTSPFRIIRLFNPKIKKVKMCFVVDGKVLSTIDKSDYDKAIALITTAKDAGVANAGEKETIGNQTPQSPSGPPRQASGMTSFKGSGIQNTRPFTVSSPWEIVWDGQGKAVYIVIYNSDGSIAGGAGNDTGKGRSYQPKGGTYYLNIMMGENWQVSVVPVAE